jgi:hypothetical protein
MRKSLYSLLAGLFLLMPIAASADDWRWHGNGWKHHEEWHHHHHYYPRYYNEVIVAPHPVYYYTPAPVVVVPRPVYYYPQPQPSISFTYWGF